MARGMKEYNTIGHEFEENKHTASQTGATPGRRAQAGARWCCLFGGPDRRDVVEASVAEFSIEDSEVCTAAAVVERRERRWWR